MTFATRLQARDDAIQANFSHQRQAGNAAHTVGIRYNIGLGSFGKSSVLRLHNQKDRKGAGDAFLMWTKAGGRELPGLVRRREAERGLYTT